MAPIRFNKIEINNRNIINAGRLKNPAKLQDLNKKTKINANIMLLGHKRLLETISAYKPASPKVDISLNKISVSSLLTEKLKIKDIDKAWQYYFDNSGSLPEITKGLEKYGIENPFIDKNGEIKRYLDEQINRRRNMTQCDKILTIIDAIVRKPPSLELSTKEKIEQMLGKAFVKYDKNVRRKNGVQLPAEVLISGHAQCLEYSYLFVAMARIAGIKAGIVFVPGHAFNWFKLNGKIYELDMTTKQGKPNIVLSMNLLRKISNTMPFTELKTKPASGREIFRVHHWVKGLKLSDQFEYAEAEKEFKTALIISPNDKDTIDSLCILYDQIGKSSLAQHKLFEAEKVYYKQLDLRPNDPLILDNLQLLGMQIMYKEKIDQWTSSDSEIDALIKRHPCVKHAIRFLKEKDGELEGELDSMPSLAEMARDIIKKRLGLK